MPLVAKVFKKFQYVVTDSITKTHQRETQIHAQTIKKGPYAIQTASM